MLGIVMLSKRKRWHAWKGGCLHPINLDARCNRCIGLRQSHCRPWDRVYSPLAYSVFNFNRLQFVRREIVVRRPNATWVAFTEKGHGFSQTVSPRSPRFPSYQSISTKETRQGTRWLIEYDTCIPSVATCVSYETCFDFLSFRSDRRDLFTARGARALGQAVKRN